MSHESWQTPHSLFIHCSQKKAIPYVFLECPVHADYMKHTVPEQLIDSCNEIVLHHVECISASIKQPHCVTSLKVINHHIVTSVREYSVPGFCILTMINPFFCTQHANN